MDAIAAGRLDRRITIERATATRNSLGEPIKTWATLAERWAEVIPLRGREQIQAMEVSAEIPTRFRIRWLEGLLPTDRIVYGGRVYEVHSINEIGRRVGWEILASARADKVAS